MARARRSPSDAEQRLIQRIMAALDQRDGLASGQLYRHQAAGFERPDFERVLAG